MRIRAIMNRNVPTSLYIDTSILVNQGLRFDTKDFKLLKDTFTKGGLRLLVPEVMERELLRKFDEQAANSSRAVIKARKEYPINKLTLAELPIEEDLVEMSTQEMTCQWDSFKEHFVVEELSIAGDLEDVVKWYFEGDPPFSKKNSKEFPDAFIISALDNYHKQCHARIAVVSTDKEFEAASAIRRHFSYFSNLGEYIEKFKPELSGKEQLPGEIDLTKPIATEDLEELKSILARGSEPTPIEINRVLQLLQSRGTNYDYFFQNVADVFWLQILLKAGYFRYSVNTGQTAGENDIVQWWLPLRYLVRIFEAAPCEVVDIVSEFPNTDNFWDLKDIFEIVQKTDSVEVVFKLSRFIVSFIENYRLGHELIISLLNKPFFFDYPLSKVAPAILLKIVEFCTDLQVEHKAIWNSENLDAWDTRSQSTPRFDRWEYKQILEEGVRSLAERQPFQVACILVDAVASMIRLGPNSDDVDIGINEDYSEYWCPRLDNPDKDYQLEKQIQVHSLTYACELVYSKVPESIDALDKTLKNHRWKIFQRLRHFLYATFLNNQTLPWIREEILQHDGYSRKGHNYEFQLMVRRACEHYGTGLLNSDERRIIISTILSGPSQEVFRRGVEEHYSDEAFQHRQRYFHHRQLRPFSTLLDEKIKQYFDELEGEPNIGEVSDNDYLLYSEGSGGVVSFRSPKTVDELGEFSDEDLLNYLNEWDDEHFQNNNSLVAVNTSALAGIYQELFEKQISVNCERLAFWMENRDKISRPIYVVSMLKAMIELINKQEADNLDQWLEFCAWVLSHPDSVRVDGQPVLNDKSRELPDWRNSRRTVVDFMDVCVKIDSCTPISARKNLFDLLKLVCNQPDYQLDSNQPMLLNSPDPVTEAINQTRSLALYTLIKCGIWVRHHLPEDSLSEVTDILEYRITKEAEISLTPPEFALLGSRFGNLFDINQNWTIANRSNIFSRKINTIWWCAFGSFIRFNNPNKEIFEILQDEFEFAIENVSVMSTQGYYGEDTVRKLSQFLFAYYLWGVYPLTGEASLLEKFYKYTADDQKLWAKIFDYVGRSLSSRNANFDQSLIERFVDYFHWRFEIGNPGELQCFTFWLKADCLEPDWRLDSYSKILDFELRHDANLSLEVSALKDFPSENLELVVKCFNKITNQIRKGDQVYFNSDDAKSILEDGLFSDNPKIREVAEQARENLLRAGRFEYMDVN